MVERTVTPEAGEAPAEPRQHHNLAKERRAQNPRTNERHGDEAPSGQHEQRRQHRRDERRQQRRQRGESGTRFQGGETLLDAGAEKQGGECVKSQKGQGDRPRPAEVRSDGERARFQETLAQPRAEPRGSSGYKISDRTPDHRRPVALDRAGDTHDLAVDARVGSEFEIAEHHDDTLFDRAVDVTITEYGDDGRTDRTGHTVVAKDRDHRIDDFAIGRRLAKYRDDGLGFFIFFEQRIRKHRDDGLARRGLGHGWSCGGRGGPFFLGERGQRECEKERDGDQERAKGRRHGRESRRVHGNGRVEV